MAKHDRIISLSGKLGDLIFVKQKKGAYAKSKSFKKLNQTEATKKSSKDFGSATSTAAKIRKAFAPLVKKYGDDTLINRLNKQLIAVFTSISSVFSGKKELIQGDVKLLNGFQFSSLKGLDSLVYKLPQCSLVEDGQLHIEIEGGQPSELFKVIAQSTSATLNLMIYNMDLNGTDDELIPINALNISFNSEFRGANLNIPLNLVGERLLLVAMGVHYSKPTGEIGSQKARAASIICSEKLKNGVAIPFIAIEPVNAPAEKTKPPGLDWDLD